MSRFSSIAQSILNSNKEKINSSEFASYGAIHLNNTNLNKAIQFWTNVVGMKQRDSSAKTAEFGTDTQTLVVVHETAKTSFKKGYSGLYHVAIHAPNIIAFANMINRLVVNNYPFSPVDHTMSKSVYLDDPDGINIEFTLETPERFKRVVTQSGLKIEDSEGNVKSASAYLDVNAVLKHAVADAVNKPISNHTYIGHLHLYANNVDASNVFYKNIGFNQFNYLPQFMYADLGAGGSYKHRMAMNSWHGMNKPLAPSDSAGMRHFQININSESKLKQALDSLSDYEETDGGYWCFDPTGNKILLKHG